MKKLLTIFSVFLAICIANPRAGVAADACQPQTCDPREARLYVVEGNTNLCFGCEYGDDEHECDKNAVAGHKTVDGYIKSVWICAGSAGSRKWDDISSSAVWASVTDIKPANFERNDRYKCGYSLDGTTIDYSSTVASLPLGGTPSKICKCEPGKIPNANNTDCIDNPAGQQACENAPSYGQWQNNTCICNKEGQKDKDPGKTCECQSGLEFDAGQNKCINPNQSAIDDCRNSGGQWDERDPNNPKCTCSTAKGFDETPVDNKCVCADAPDKQYDAVADACVATEQAICTNSGGDWDGTSCTCDSNKHLKQVRGVTPVRCECESDRYEYYPNHRQGCKLTQQAQREEDTFEKLSDSCDKSGGVWQGYKENRDSWVCVCDAAKGLRTENNICECLDDRYQRSKSNPRICELTDIANAKRNCEDAHNAGENVNWIDAGQNSYCKCLDSSKYYDYNTKKCISTLEQWCAKIPGAHIIRGKCICKGTNAGPVNGRCPADKNAKGGASVNQTNTTATRNNIKAAHDKLATISNAWDKSHWKTASGNFNGARLASDSVAGVVLGTVGGVITSNVIKKNQVRGGFEDMRCVIGGQTVADWGDQFMVGVQ